MTEGTQNDDSFTRDEMKRIRQMLNTDVPQLCPRCGGEMLKQVDPRQKHIWYESCADCEGSFFDAGEFRDLSQLTLSDFFKGVLTKSRA